MSYVFIKNVPSSFEQTLDRIRAERAKEGFGILTEIDVKATLKTKLDVVFRNYRNLGACNPPYAYKALQTEAHIGAMLPGNVIVQDYADGKVDVAAIDPLLSTQAKQPKMSRFKRLP